MSAFGNSKKRRQQAAYSNRLKQVKAVVKPPVEDVYPFPIPYGQTISADLKHYINELQREYIERYNILVNNRIIYEEVFENISTELDQKGVHVQKLAQLYKNYKALEHKDKMQQES